MKLRLKAHVKKASNTVDVHVTDWNYRDKYYRVDAAGLLALLNDPAPMCGDKWDRFLEIAKRGEVGVDIDPACTYWVPFTKSQEEWDSARKDALEQIQEDEGTYLGPHN